VHLVGSVPLADSEAVFRTATDLLGRRLRRLPDGETGERVHWIAWQRAVFGAHPSLEVDRDGRYHPRADVDPATVRFDDLGYARAAGESWVVFDRLQHEGVIPDDVRFQVSVPTPLAPVVAFVAPDAQGDLETPYLDALHRELDKIFELVPSDRLAIQWDVRPEMWMWEGWVPAPFDDVGAGVVERLVRLGADVPDGVELGYHLCYGGWKDPPDAAAAVAVANALAAVLPRPVQWFHLPVPRSRTDDAYFAPLAALALRPGTEVYLGLVHLTDGVDGTEARIATARRHLPRFGVATECGFGRRPPDTIVDLLQVHAVVAPALDGSQPAP